MPDNAQQANRRLGSFFVGAIGLMFLAAAAFFGVWLPYDAQSAIASLPSRAPGHVVEHRPVTASDGQSTTGFVAVVSFSADGKDVRFNSKYSSTGLQTTWPVGSGVTVAYDPHAPDQAMAIEIESQGQSLFRIIGASAVVMGLLIIVLGQVLLR